MPPCAKNQEPNKTSAACVLPNAYQTSDLRQTNRKGKRTPAQKEKTRCTQVQIGSKSRRTKGREGFLSHEFVDQSLNPPSQILALEERRKETEHEHPGEQKGRRELMSPGKKREREWGGREIFIPH